MLVNARGHDPAHRAARERHDILFPMRVRGEKKNCKDTGALTLHYIRYSRLRMNHVSCGQKQSVCDNGRALLDDKKIAFARPSNQCNCSKGKETEKKANTWA